MTIQIRKIADNPNATPPTITLAFDPVPGATGYVMYANGKRVSNTWDPLKHTWKVDAGHEPYRIEAVNPLDAGEYPAGGNVGTLMRFWQITLQPNNQETAGDNYSFAWVKAKRNGIPKNSQPLKEGRIPFDLYPDGFWQVFARQPTASGVGRTCNWHVSPWPNGWSDEVSPYAWDWYDGRTYEGAKGLVAVLEPASTNPPYHYEVIPQTTWAKGGLWWFVTHTKPGRPGRTRAWALSPQGVGALVLDVRKSNMWKQDSELLFWNGGYDSQSQRMTRPGYIGVTLDGLGGTFEEAMSNVPELGDILTSKAKGDATPTTVVEADPVLRPDSLIRAMVDA